MEASAIKLIRTKTFWAGVGGVVSAVGGFATGMVPLPEAIQLAVGSLMGIFIRHGMVRDKAGR